MYHHKLKSSSSIEHIDYYPEKDVLEIKFTSGLTYHYPGCPIEHYHALKECDSAGKYFAQNVRNAYKGYKLFK
jgi:hypothetical protein